MKQTQLTELLTPIVAELGLECLGVEYNPSAGRGLLRVYIDAKERPVNLDDCETVSRQISVILDADDVIPEQYTLEVSSPGLDRPLFTPTQFACYIGQQVKLTLHVPRANRRRFQGVICSVVDGVITLEQDGEPIAIVHENIQKAHLVAVYPGAATKKPGRRK